MCESNFVVHKPRAEVLRKNMKILQMPGPSNWMRGGRGANINLFKLQISITIRSGIEKKKNDCR